MNLIASTSTFSFFTLISRILGYVRDILIAIFLGTSLFADAFFVAFRLPNTFRRLFAEGTFNAAFIPSYAGALAKNQIEANNFAKSVFNLLFTISQAHYPRYFFWYQGLYYWKVISTFKIVIKLFCNVPCQF